jgi:hypothetical protein
MTEEPGKIKKIFLSDWELRKLNAAGRGAGSFPENAIISPLSSDWMGADLRSRTAGCRARRLAG